MRKFLTADFAPRGENLGLLVLRIVAGVTLLLRHGLEKVQHFPAMAAHFPDPLHFGSTASLAIALIGDFVCSILIALGLFTRWAALWAFVNIFVAWGWVHHFAFFGPGGGHGELMVLYLGAFLAIVLAGAGKYSIDELL